MPLYVTSQVSLNAAFWDEFSGTPSQTPHREAATVSKNGCCCSKCRFAIAYCCDQMRFVEPHAAMRETSDYLSLHKALAFPVASILHTFQEGPQVVVACSLSRCICAFHSCGSTADIVLSCKVEDGADAMLSQHTCCRLQSLLTLTCTTSGQQSATSVRQS